MTKPHSDAHENGGRCESCNRPESQFEAQTRVPLEMASGNRPGETVMGSWWLCPSCMAKRKVSAVPLVTKIDVKASGCVQDYHPPECAGGTRSCKMAPGDYWVMTTAELEKAFAEIRERCAREAERLVGCTPAADFIRRNIRVTP